MATVKRKVRLIINAELYEDFKAIRELRNESSLSSVILELAKDGLEKNEDLYFAKIAESRLNDKRYSHEKVWTKKKWAKQSFGAFSIRNRPSS